MGNYFIELARKDMERLFITLPDRDLAYFPERTEHFDDYVEAVEWAQDFARWNRHLMMEQIVTAVRSSGVVRPFIAELKASIATTIMWRESPTMGKTSLLLERELCEREKET
jgi:tRNA-splicing ligase RtcB